MCFNFFLVANSSGRVGDWQLSTQVPDAMLNYGQINFGCADDLYLGISCLFQSLFSLTICYKYDDVDKQQSLPNADTFNFCKLSFPWKLPIWNSYYTMYNSVFFLYSVVFHLNEKDISLWWRWTFFVVTCHWQACKWRKNGFPILPFTLAMAFPFNILWSDQVLVWMNWDSTKSLN